MPRARRFKRGAPIDDLDRRIIAIVLRNPAATDQSIADELKCDRHTIARRRARPEYVAEVNARILPAREILRNSRPHAAKVLLSIMASGEARDADRISASKAILGPELVGQDADATATGPSVPISGDVAAGLLRYFGALHGGTLPTGGTRTA